MPKIFQVKCQTERVSTLANNCLSILLHTGDTSRFKPEELTELFRMANEEKEFWVAFSEMKVREQDLKIDEPEVDETGLSEKKTPHKELFDLYLAYTKIKYGNFEKAKQLYIDAMKNMSNQVRNKIDELKLTNN